MTSRLRTALARSRRESTSESRAELFDVLRGAPIWIAADEDISHLAEYSDVPLPQVRFATCMHADGTLVIGFSDNELGLAFRAGAHPLLEVRGQRLIDSFASLHYDGLLLDPEQAGHAVVTRRELLALASRRDPLAEAERVVADGLGSDDIRRSSAVVDDNWSRKLFAALTTFPTVRAAHLIDVRLGGVLAPRVIVEFDFDTDDSEDAGVIAVLREHFGRRFDIMMSSDPIVLRACRNVGRQLY